MGGLMCSRQVTPVATATLSDRAHNPPLPVDCPDDFDQASGR